MGNADFDNRPKLKKTTGIPKMFLKTVETRDAAGMVTETGELVIAQPNEYVPTGFQRLRRLTNRFPTERPS